MASLAAAVAKPWFCQAGSMMIWSRSRSQSYPSRRLFFPWDAHRPALMLGDASATSRKCVIKISVELLKD